MAMRVQKQFDLIQIEGMLVDLDFVGVESRTEVPSNENHPRNEIADFPTKIPLFHLPHTDPSLLQFSRLAEYRWRNVCIKLSSTQIPPRWPDGGEECSTQLYSTLHLLSSPS